MSGHSGGWGMVDGGRLARAQGCLMGQLVGDALGSMVEFQAGEQIRRDYPAGLREIVPSACWNTIAGQPTDDSEMALALARTLVEDGTYNDDSVAQAYGRWLQSEPFDVGNTVRQATDAMVVAMENGGSAAEAGRSAANRTSQANGALMRESPLAIWGSSLPPGELAGIVCRDVALTHPHTACQDASAVCIIAAAAAIREGLDRAATYERALDWQLSHGSAVEVTDALKSAQTEPPDYERQAGWVLVALQNAFYQCLHATDLEDGVVQTVMSGGDTDTNAAITGMLLGAIHGIDAIPAQWVQAVLNCRPRAVGQAAAHPRPENLWPADAMKLAERLLVGPCSSPKAPG